MSSAKFTIKYLLFLATVLLAVNGVFYLFFISKINHAVEHSRYDALDPQFVDATTMLNLGWVSPPRRSSFIHFDPRKAPGVVRIGCIGDSYTYGDEASPQEDYPALLQRLFEDRGYKNVEVINFGSSFYSFHQSFITWKHIAKKYSLDVVILGPRSFYRTREVHMNHPGVPLAIHARYIVAGNQVELVPVAGETKDEVVERYHSFIPERRYLKFDLDPPAFLKALIPSGRKLRNPFYYYSGTIREEVDRIYIALLTEMSSDSDTQIILSNFDQSITELGSKVGGSNLHPLHLTKNWRFPNVMQRRHYSGHGNALLARKYFWEMTGDDRDVFKSIEFADLPLKAGEEEIPNSSLPLIDFERLDVHIGAQFAGTFQYDNSNLFNEDERGPYSLLAIKSRKTSILDAIFVPLAFEIEEGEPIWLEVGSGASSTRVTIGKLALVTGQFNIGVVETDDLEPDWKMSPSMTLAESLRSNHLDASRFSLYLGTHLISSGRGVKREEPVELRPISGDFAKIRSAKGSRLSIDRLEETGVVSLVATRADQSTLVASIATYRLNDVRAEVELDSLARKLKLRNPAQTASY